MKKTINNKLPELPYEVTVNEFFNISAHHASENKINANANLLTLWAKEIAGRGFNPEGVMVVTPTGRYKIFKQNDYWQINQH